MAPFAIRVNETNIILGSTLHEYPQQQFKSVL